MKILFAKYNRERLPKFQTVTKIVELANGQQKAIKQSLMPEAQAHIAEIYANYARLTAKYPKIKLVPPTLEDGNTVTFPMAEGVSLENLLKQALDKQDKSAFFALLDKFVVYVDSFVTQNQVKFVPCDKFKQVFGEWTLDEPQDLIELANVDLIFGNLFVADDGSITQIDYEWAFECAVPKTFVLWRAFNVFAYFMSVHIYKFTSLFEAFESYNITNYDNQQWLSMDLSWQAYIRGKNTPYMFKNSMQRGQIDIFSFVNQLQEKISQLQQSNELKQAEIQKNSAASDYKINMLQLQLANKIKELDEVYHSNSWEITAPLRKIFNKFQQVGSKNEKIGDVGNENKLFADDVFKEQIGFCVCCDQNVTFIARHKWLIDHYLCSNCQCIPRERALMKVIQDICPNYADLKIHESSPGNRGASVKLSKCNGYIASHYYPNHSENTVNDFYNINLQNQAFEDDKFDLVITQDVFEHLPDPSLAIKEIARTLKVGGFFISTIPLVNKWNRTQQWAKLNNGGIEWLYTPDIHGNPIDSDGSPSPVFWHYGYDIANLLTQESGMETVIIQIKDDLLGIDAEFIEVVVCRKVK